MTVTFAYITTGGKDEARIIGRALVESRLAACVNILDPMESIYRWEGKMASDQETVLIAKTTTGKLEALKAKVVAMHSYECPCILTFSVSGGHEPFMKWIEEQVNPVDADGSSAA